MPLPGDPEPPADAASPPQAEPDRPTLAERVMALLEVLICSGYPTQLALGATLMAFGIAPIVDGQLNFRYIVVVSLADTVLLLLLILLFLSVHDERPREMFLGDRSIVAEARAGVVLAFGAFALGIAVLLAIRLLTPWLNDVEQNPIKDLIKTPRDAAIFAFVVIVAGGLREEIQRAFLLRRFERWLGGGAVGLAVTSAFFGLGHQTQGVAAAIATGVLGAFWGVVYLRRRSAVAPIVSHAGFDLIQLAQLVTLGR